MPKNVVLLTKTASSGLNESTCAFHANLTRIRPPIKKDGATFMVGDEKWYCHTLYDSAKMCKCLQVNETKTKTAAESDVEDRRKQHAVPS